MKNREILTQMLARVHPELDLGDEEVLFGLIFDDYEHYATLLGADYDSDSDSDHDYDSDSDSDHDSDHDSDSDYDYDTTAQTKAPMPSLPPLTDGLPALGGGGNPRRAAPGSSIFDLARGA